MKKFKRFYASVTAVVMLMGTITTNVHAEINESSSIQLTATEVEGSPRLDDLKTEPHKSQVEALYDDDELVTVIVEMDDAPVMDYYRNTSYFSLDEETSAGEAVSKFLESKDAKETSEEIENSHNKIVSKINKLMKNNSKEKSTKEIEVIKSWSTIVNAIAIRIPYGMINEIKNIDGVKGAYVEKVYDLPEPIIDSVVEADKGRYSYSYDMVGIEETWGNGYTGKGMLVAVLDSGLDVKMDWTQKVVRTHEAFTDNSFKSGNPTDGVADWELRYTSDSIEKFMKDNQLNSNTGTNGDQINYDTNVQYKNLKVPYAWDYADNDFNVLNESSDHGTHVSGTITGFSSTEEGEVNFSGVSPDAQLLFMKVFSNDGGGATQNVLISAIEDSLKLGADVVNLSLGSSNGFADDDTFQNDIYNRVNKAGVVLMTSAGNSYKSSEGNNYNGDSLTSNQDESMISSPAVYNSNLSVASMENTIDVKPYLTWNDSDGQEHKVYFNDPWSVAMKADFSDKEYPIYAVDGVGTYSDYYNAGFNNGWNNGKTGLALVKRGEISFKDKINNALSFAGKNSQGKAYGVLGVIVYDNDAEGTELITMSVEGTALDSAYISGKDGSEIVNAIKAGYEVKIKVSKDDETVDSPIAGQMSSFTSWGAGPGLELKPEITAPGGNIWSTVVDKVNTSNEGYTGSYEMMSGTSMAAPHMTGIGSLIRQRVLNESAFSGISPDSIGNVVSQLLISTAVPKTDNNGVYYSPRQQGAGLVNAAAASSTPAYITVDGENVGKLELGDDSEKEGKFNINFNLNNISENTVKYNAEVVLMRPDTTTTDSKWGERNIIADNNVVIKTVPLGEISAAKGESKSFSKVISLSESEKSELDNLFENGTYVEGYVILTDATNNGNPQLSIPMLAYYGDWTKAPIFDSSLWIDEPADGENVLNNESTWGTSVVGSYQINDIYGVIDFFNLGQNVFDANSVNNQLKYEKENIALSPNGDEYLDRIDNYVLYQLRDAKAVVVEAKNAETGEVYMRDWTAYSTKSLYEPSLGLGIPYSIYDTFPTWNGTDKEGNVLPSGTKCIYTITAYGEGDYGEKVFNDDYGKDVTDFDSIIPGQSEPTFNGHNMDKTGDVISFPVVIDTVAPKLQNNAVSIYEKDGRTYITGKVYDEDGSLASVEIAPYIKRTYKEGYGDPNYSETGIDRNNPFYINNVYDPATKELTFDVDVTEYIHSNESFPGENSYYDYTWTGNVLISCGDYGINDRSYAIKVDSSEGIVLSTTSALLKTGDEFELSVNNNTGDVDSKLTRTSSNPEVATVDDYGHVKAIAPGQAVITVSNGKSSAVCVVAVEERNTEVKDFELSIDSFTGLKPDGQVVVNVKNIQPADAVVNDIVWEVIEDEDFVNQYGSGLLRIGKNTADKLSGYLYLSSNTSVDKIPAGEAEVRVTINNVQKSMKVSWEQLYESYNDDDLLSSQLYKDQSIYISQGETATLNAQYRQPSLHQIGDVNTELTGLKLDGPDFFNIGGKYTAKLVNDEGYTLPSDIHLYTVYPDGYKQEIINYEYYKPYTYDSTTGEIVLNYAPSGASNKLLIVAEGIQTEGAVAGTMSNEVYNKPDGMFGPFDWTLTNGNGTLELGESVISGTTVEAAKYTPSEPGISYITATTKDGKYSVDFAVISEPVVADSLTIDKNKAEIYVGDTINAIATLSPDPTFESDKGLTWTSFNPEVATVAEDGTITGVSEGYAYIKVNSTTNNKLKNYCIVKVVANYYNVTFKDYDGKVLKEEVVEEGKSATAPEAPKRDGYNFKGWDVSFEKVTEDLVVTAQYSKIENGGSGEEVNKFTVIFKDYDGTILKKEEVEEGKNATAPEAPTREGYKFDGWDTSFEKVTKDIIVTAKYTKLDDGSGDEVNKYTVIFKDYDGKVLKEEVVEEGKSATAPEAPTREGYKFDGWDTSFENVTKGLIVTAKYTKVDENNGNSGSDQGNDSGIDSQNNGNNNNNNTNSDSDKEIPNTGGTNWPITVLLSLILCSCGTVLVVRSKKQ